MFKILRLANTTLMWAIHQIVIAALVFVVSSDYSVADPQSNKVQLRPAACTASPDALAGKQNFIYPTIQQILAESQNVMPEGHEIECKPISQKEMDAASVWQLPVFAPTNSTLVSKSCYRDTQIYLDHLSQYQWWALQMWDSSGKLPSGLLSGNTNQLGDFDLCMSLNGSGGQTLSAQYCLALVDLNLSHNAPRTIARAVIQMLAGQFVQSTNSDSGHFIPRFTTLRWGLCVPSSCSAADLEMGLVASLQPYNATPGVSLHLAVPTLSCVAANSIVQRMPWATIATLGFFGAVALVVLAATLMDTVSLSKDNSLSVPQRLVLSFSLHRTVKALFSSSGNDLPCVDGIRAVCTVMLYVAHKLIPLGNTPYSNRIRLTQLSHSEASSVLRASSIYTDSFLVLSGTLTAYNMSAEILSNSTISWGHKVITRYIRLTPALFATVLFYAYVLEHTGSGPQWGDLIKTNADLCKRSWIYNVIYLQNFFPFEQMCATHTHQLALDMQLSLLAPPLVLLLHVWPSACCLLLLGLTAVSAALRHSVTYNNGLSLFIYHRIKLSDLYRTADLSYSQSLHRVTPYLAGIVLGHLLFNSKGRLKTSKGLMTAGWMVAVTCALYSVFSCTHLAFANAQYSAAQAAQYAVLSPIAWAVALSWVIFACSTGCADELNSVLSLRGLIFVSRISYSVYLTQFAVFFYNAASARSAHQFRLLYAFDMVELAAVVVVSIVFTLVFDIPMQGVKSAILPVRKTKIMVNAETVGELESTSH